MSHFHCKTNFSKLALWVDFLCKFQGIAVCQIGVSGRDGEDEAGFTPDELKDHPFYLLLDVYRLVADRHLRQTRQVNQRQVEHWKIKALPTVSITMKKISKFTLDIIHIGHIQAIDITKH